MSLKENDRYFEHQKEIAEERGGMDLLLNFQFHLTIAAAQMDNARLKAGLESPAYAYWSGRLDQAKQTLNIYKESLQERGKSCRL